MKEPETNELNVSGKRMPKSYKLICKLILRKFGSLKLRSIGNASESVVYLANSLSQNGFGTIMKVYSELVDLTDNRDKVTGTKKAILFVAELKKSDNFDMLF